MFTFHLATAVKAPAARSSGENAGESRAANSVQPHTQHFLLITLKTSPLIGRGVYRQRAGNNNKQVFTPELLTQDTHALTHPHTVYYIWPRWES